MSLRLTKIKTKHNNWFLSPFYPPQYGSQKRGGTVLIIGPIAYNILSILKSLSLNNLWQVLHLS
jgi:hypothetical protein